MDGEDFPRGGFRPKTTLKRQREQDNLFATTTTTKAKKVKRQKKSQNQPDVSDDSFSSLLNHETLSYKTIRSDMIVLGCIRQIKDVSIEVELPGLTFAHINITNISDSFTNYLKENSNVESLTLLPQIFKVGQRVTTKVLSVENKENGTYVQCTLNPREINSGKHHSSFDKGLLVWASITREQEHGYEIDVGVNNCRAFLSFKNVEKDKPLHIGEPVWCVVNKSESSSAATTVQVSCRSDQLKKCKIEEIDSLHNLIPGMKIDVLVDKVKTSGLVGKFLNDFFAYIDETQLEKSATEYKEGNLLTAYVLYVDHTIKVTHFTMFNLDTMPLPKYNEGDVLVGEVISRTRRGIYLSLPSKEKCFVTNKRLLLSFPKRYSNCDLSDTVKLKFVVGSRHSCRILSFSNATRSYIGTLEQSVIREKFFTIDDIKAGQFLDATIDQIVENGLVLKAGRLKGFVPNLYLSNVAYSENIKKKFKKGGSVKARVLDVTNNNVILTLKPGQVNSDQCLTDLDQAKRGDKYPGVIVSTFDNGALVSFYSNVKGWLGKKYLDEQDDDNKPDPQKLFFRGQVINPWVLGVNDTKLVLSLRPPKDFDTFGVLTIGQKINGVVSKISKDKLFVKTLKGKPIGMIPANHISENTHICSTLIGTYKVGDKVDNLVCIDNTSTPNVLSRREGLAITRIPSFRVKSFAKLKRGHLVRCFYASRCETGIYVRPLIVDFTEKVLIDKKDIVDGEVELPQFEAYQALVAKVTEIQHDSKTLHLTAKLSKVFDNKVENVISLFSNQIQDTQTVRRFGKENKWELCEYEPGETVTCRVEKVSNDGGCLVKLKNGIPGLVPSALCPDVKKGDLLLGVFLSQNFQQKYAVVCLKPDIYQNINRQQDGVTTLSNLSSCKVEKLLIDTYCALVLLKQPNGNKQIVYLPLFVHENDFEGSCKDYYEVDKFQICICGKLENCLIGMSRRHFLNLDKRNAAVLKSKAFRVEIKNKLLNEEYEDEDSSENESKFIETDNKEKSNQDDKEVGNMEVLDQEDEDEDVDTESDDDKLDTDEEDEMEEQTIKLKDVDTNEEVDTEEEVEMSDSDEDLEMGVTYEDTKMEEDAIPEGTLNTHLTNVKVKKETLVKTISPSDPITGPLPALSGVNSFFNIDTNGDNAVSSDDEVEETTSKKKKLTPAERAQLLKDEEEKIRKIEKELADPTKSPESAEQFDRLVLANPNSSKIWVQYMAFHVVATEFDKARAVAKRALETININCIDERFNIWLTLLNFENTYGTKESFDKVFEDAVKCNDDLDIYLETIRIFAESGKTVDMEEKIKKVRNKHKQNARMWTEVAKTYYNLGKFKEARNLKDAALRSITIKKTQLDIIVRFALMEFNIGEIDYGSAIFETILSSDPKKVAIWSTYVDQLVKKGKIDEARQVLERAVSQHLSVKNMKTLFLKYKLFEEAHGTPETVEEVKEKVKDLMTKLLAKS